MDLTGFLKGMVSTIISLIIFIILAIIYFIVILFIIKVSADLVFDTTITADYATLGAAILTAGTLIGGGSLKFLGSD